MLQLRRGAPGSKRPSSGKLKCFCPFHQNESHLGFGHGLELVVKTDSRIELGIPSKMLFEARHAERDEPESESIIEVEQMLKGFEGHPVRFGDSHQRTDF